MAEIFKAQGIAREALAALALFVEAAQKETVTVELVKRVIQKVEGGRSSSPQGRRGEAWGGSLPSYTQVALLGFGLRRSSGMIG